MTDPHNESIELNNSANPSEPIVPGNIQNENPTGSEPTSNDPTSPTDGDASAANAEDGLPEWEPLTPELVEDEAIRGDFVMRWVVAGLALLLGVSQIAETRTLIHIKSGQYLTSHGFLPAAKDVFSISAADRTWVNLSWLFDISTSFVHSFGGGIGLSIFQGLLAGLAFGLLAHAVRPEIRTWWGSICAVLALLASYTQFTVQPELITLLGLSIVLWLIIRCEETGNASRLWLLVPTLWIWAQCDNRAWYGWLLIGLWAVGEQLSARESTSRLPWGKVALASVAVVGLHPFLWESWLAPINQYLIDYPAMQFAYKSPLAADQVFYPIWSSVHWGHLNHRMIASFVLTAATIVTMLLNSSRTRWSHLLAFLGFNVLSVFATHELAAAALVNCVICTVNAQTWYREKFGQVYSIDWRELLFSRGGRAVTVLSFFVLAWLILSGRLDGPAGKRSGIGFDAHLATAMSDYEQLQSNLIDDHPFNFSMRQGDLMIWGGIKPFVDSRASLYAGSGSRNLLSLHDQTRKAFLKKNEKVIGSGEPDVWLATFEKYKIRQACPRLNGPTPMPDYGTFNELLASGRFRLSYLNSSTAVFIKDDPTDESITAFFKEHPFDIVEKAFGANVTGLDDVTREWAKPATTYDDLFSLRRPIFPGGVQLAQHYYKLVAALSDSPRASTMIGAPKAVAPGAPGSTPLTAQMASILLAIRSANEGLRSEPNSVGGYQILGHSYKVLGQIEAVILQQAKMNVPNPVRYYQTVAAFQQAISLQPNDPEILRELVVQYGPTGRADIQLDLLKRVKKLMPSKGLTDQQRSDRESVIDLIGQLEDRVSQIDTMVEKHLSEDADRFQVAAGAYQAGGLLKAIKVLEDDAVYLERTPQAKLALGRWLLEVGRLKDAEAMFEGLEGYANEMGLIGWRDGAAISALTAGNYLRTIRLWNEQIQSSSAQLTPVMYTLPFARLNPAWMGSEAYPMSHISAATEVLRSSVMDGATLSLHLALAQMEMGTPEEAVNSLHQALKLDPQSPYRPIIRFYLESLKKEQIDLAPPVVEIEELADLAEPEATTSKP